MAAATTDVRPDLLDLSRVAGDREDGVHPRQRQEADQGGLGAGRIERGEDRLFLAGCDAGAGMLRTRRHARDGHG